jgi:hypothetical protein
MKISLLPAELVLNTSSPGFKSALSLNWPLTYTLPPGAAATEFP